jgi:putative intracellular protease/amidase
MTKTILFVLTAHSDFAGTGASTGVWLEELATPYQMMEGSGFDILFATPGGRPSPLDPASLAEPWLLPAGHWFLSQESLTAKLKNPLDIADVDAKNLDGIFLVGGTGTLWDFPGCNALGSLITNLFVQGKPVAAVCHGVVGLLTATAPDGSSLVKGKNVTCFSNEEEAMLQYDKLVPLLAETALVDKGAHYQRAAPFEPLVVVDGRLLTGQNPASAQALASALIKQIDV